MNIELINRMKSFLNSEEFKFKIKTIVEDKAVAINNSRDSVVVSEDLNFNSDLINKFVIYCKEFLSIDKSVKINLVSSKEGYSFKTLAYYIIGDHESFIYCKNRALVDCLRSLAHELVHNCQDYEGRIDSKQIGETNDGVPIENEANAKAGEIIRIFGREYPEIYDI